MGRKGKIHEMKLKGLFKSVCLINTENEGVNMLKWGEGIDKARYVLDTGIEHLEKSLKDGIIDKESAWDNYHNLYDLLNDKSRDVLAISFVIKSVRRLRIIKKMLEKDDKRLII